LNQAELRQLATERIRDAEALIAGGRWEFAYYAAGYAVECGLKSCLLARMIHTGWVFLPKVRIDECLTHDFGSLIGLAGLRVELNAKLAASAASAAPGGPPGGLFSYHWGTALQWKVTSRYESKTEAEARALYEAITHDPDGILRWIQNYW
jgi:hypothetical protein